MVGAVGELIPSAKGVQAEEFIAMPATNDTTSAVAPAAAEPAESHAQAPPLSNEEVRPPPGSGVLLRFLQPTHTGLCGSTMAFRCRWGDGSRRRNAAVRTATALRAAVGSQRPSPLLHWTIDMESAPTHRITVCLTGGNCPAP